MMKRLAWLHDHLPQKVWDNLATVSILGLLAVLVWFEVQTLDLIRENRHRISDQQASRVFSCQQTYESFRDVFGPFLPKHPRGKQRRDIEKFNRIIDRKKAACARQTSAKEER
jgi:hypothetical protein